jgi:glyoxylase-like metal-dependent hydrolase (beta-lactamase superfamily II)
VAGESAVGHVTAPVVAVAEQLPGWVRLIRAPNPGPMTLDGTNTWLLRAPGEAGSVVVDPGPADEEHLRAVAAAAGTVAGVLVTHGHPDHVDGLARFRELASGTSKHRCELTGAAVGRTSQLAGLAVTVIETPGHTADSVCFLVEADGERAVFTGDTILGRGTTVVAWPDGDLGDYLSSLQRLSVLDGVPALPGHGPPLTDCAAAASYYLKHRRARLEQVRAAVAAGATTPEQVVAMVYADVDRALWPAAEWSVRAQLAYLDRAQRESGTRPPPLDSP